ncbi:MAG TPA: glycosyl transferase family 1 [Gammaproteobacteria bacterium]|jgi:glycosyltransferase involved in cell wall biosynthesis|nr:glycosyl transferase family 1 [Gammaproteobacteria bacterium]
MLMSGLPQAMDHVPDEDCVASAHLRVVILSDAESERNGVGAYYHDLVDLLKDDVAEIALFCPGAQGMSPGLRLPLPGDATQNVWLPPLRAISSAVREIQPDVIIVPTPGPYGLLGARLAKKHKARLVVGFHTHFEKIMDLYWSRWFGALTVGYFNLLNLYLFKRSELILANSSDMVEIVRQRSQTPALLMGTPIPRRYLTKPRAEPTVGVNTVLYAGRLAAEKNVAAVIAAAHAMPEVQFQVAGDGPDRERVEQAAAKLRNLRCLGWLSRDAMLDVLDASDMLVLPSHIESFGTIALEAMAREKLVLVSSRCGICAWPQLRRGLFEYSPGECLSDGIRRVMAVDAGERDRVRRVAREGAEHITQWNLNNWLTILAGEAIE